MLIEFEWSRHQRVHIRIFFDLKIPLLAYWTQPKGVTFELKSHIGDLNEEIPDP